MRKIGFCAQYHPCLRCGKERVTNLYSHELVPHLCEECRTVIATYVSNHVIFWTVCANHVGLKYLNSR